VNAAAVQTEVNLIAGDDTSEPLGYPGEFDTGRRGASPLGACHFGRCLGHPPP